MFAKEQCLPSKQLFTVDLKHQIKQIKQKIEDLTVQTFTMYMNLDKGEIC